MRLLIVGTLEGQLGAASQIAMDRGAKVTHAPDVDTALAILRTRGADLMMVELSMDIPAFIPRLRAEHFSIPIIACGIGTDPKAAATAIRGGAKEYIPLPPDAELIAAVLEAVAEDDQSFIYSDAVMKNVIALAEQVAPSEASILVTGESGTGKEVMARFVHQKSRRANKPFVAVNCAAIPENLLESELFGHEKGAFTGATTSRKGRFLLADKGTIFLDEIGELPLDLQPKLLRVIQEGEFDPVGSSETIKVDVRIIAATHRDLLEFSKTGKFREDLYYRLNVFPIVVPALKDRGDDVCLIADRMVKQFSKKMNKYIEPLTDDQKKLFLEYDWPGNVRELQNLIERAIIVSNNGQVNWQNIIPHDSLDKANTESAQSNRILTSKEMVQLEKENILKALRQTNWKISGENGAAALLQLRPTTLTSKIKALGIIRPV